MRTIVGQGYKPIAVITVHIPLIGHSGRTAGTCSEYGKSILTYRFTNRLGGNHRVGLHQHNDCIGSGCRSTGAGNHNHIGVSTLCHLGIKQGQRIAVRSRVLSFGGQNIPESTTIINHPLVGNAGTLGIDAKACRHVLTYR